MKKTDIHIFPDGRMKPKDAAFYTGFSEGSLANWRSTGEGPKFIKQRGRIFYQKNDLDKWMGQNAGFVTTAQARLTLVD